MMEAKLKRLNNIMKSNLVVVTQWTEQSQNGLTVPGKAADYGADAVLVMIIKDL